jgi:hypothetical protein
VHNADDDTEEMKRRIAAFCRLHDVPMTELAGWLFVTGKDTFRNNLFRANKRRLGARKCIYTLAGANNGHFRNRTPMAERQS